MPHPLFPPPDDPYMRIWRYLDFTKFVFLLHRREIYFSRADQLGDRFEGSYPRGNQSPREQLLRELQENVPQAADFILRSVVDTHKAVTAWTYLNCWHIGQHESIAMWKIYTKTTEAVAVQSTYLRLRSVLPERVLVGKVQYIDFDKGAIPENNILYPFLYKRLSFSFENELRALFLDVPIKEGAVIYSPEVQPRGKCITVDIDTLIERIYVAPTAPIWFLELVKDVTNKYELSKNVLQSSIDSDPFY